jgi:hypothetical protein
MNKVKVFASLIEYPNILIHNMPDNHSTEPRVRLTHKRLGTGDMHQSHLCILLRTGGDRGMTLDEMTTKLNVKLHELQGEQITQANIGTMIEYTAPTNEANIELFSVILDRLAELVQWAVQDGFAEWVHS